jgi:hypothetical protein
VVDRTRSGAASAESPRRLFSDNRFVIFAACLVAIVGILVGGHLYGQYLASLESRGRDNAMEQLRSQSQALKQQVNEKAAQLSQAQAKLQSTQATLESILPSKNTYNISPNQALNVGDGHLTVGMIGSPGNDSVVLDINGKQQAVGVGQVLNVAGDQSTNCLVAVQSFDVFKAVITAICTVPKAE